MTAAQLNILFSILASTATVLTFIVVVVLIPVLRRVWRMLKGWDSFIRDWNGEPAQPGRDAAPGVMDRLNNLDGEFKRNHGSTLKDAVVRVEDTLEDLNHPETGVRAQMSSMGDRIDARFVAMDQRIDIIQAHQTGKPYPRKAV